MATNNAINSAKPIGVASGGTGATTYTTDGVLYFDGTNVASTSAGTSGQVLSSGGAGVAPSYATLTGSGCTTFVTDSGTATISGTQITVSGTSSKISTVGASATVTLSIPSSPSLAGTLTVASGLVVTTGNAAVSAGNVTLPTTSSTVGQITINSLRALCMLGTRSFQAGNAANTSGTFTDDVYIGDGAGSAATTTSNNVIIGSGAGKGTSMTNNVIIGYQAMKNTSLTSANNNTVIGYQAGLNMTNAPAYNVLIGASAGSAYTTAGESSNILVMNSGLVGESNVLRLGTAGSGNGQVNKAFMAGIFGVTVGVSGIAVNVDNAGQLGTTVSSRVFKTDIQDLGEKSEAIYKLRPVTFQYKKDPTDYPQYGLIAEEVAEVFPDLVSHDLSGAPYSVKYQDIPILLLNELQKQAKILASLEARLNVLEE